MSEKIPYERLICLIAPKKAGDHDWFLSLLDDEKQREYEDEHMEVVMQMLRLVRIRPHKNAIRAAKAEIARMEKEERDNAETYRKIKGLLAEIEEENEKVETYHPFFEEPYFARMDLIDNKEGYNSYYIGKKGDIKLEILDWRTPVARRYYQKSCSSFTFNEYEYKTILRRAIRTKSGKVLDFKNEYLSLKDFPSFTIDADVPPPVVHAFLGAYVAEHVLNITDTEVLDAIRYHTSGRAKMSNLEKLIFVADMVEEGRTYLGVEKLRKAYYEDDFEKAFIQCLKEEVLHLLNKKQYIYYRTLEAYEYYVNNKR